MAISLGGYKKYGAAMDEHKRQKKEYEAMQAQAAKRKKQSGFLGSVLGGGLGMILPGILGVASGGLLAPLLMAGGSFLGKKAAHEMTKGMAINPGLLKAQGKFGTGEKSAESLRTSLESQMVKDESDFGQDLLS